MLEWITHHWITVGAALAVTIAFGVFMSRDYRRVKATHAARDETRAQLFQEFVRVYQEARDLITKDGAFQEAKLPYAEKGAQIFGTFFVPVDPARQAYFLLSCDNMCGLRIYKTIFDPETGTWLDEQLNELLRPLASRISKLQTALKSITPQLPRELP